MKFAKFSLFLTACSALISSSFATERVVSIGGDVTEILYALGAERQLIGRDSTSTVPQQAKMLPDIGYMRQLNTEGILSLKPTRIIATSAAQPSIVLEQVKSAGVHVDHIPLEYTPESVVAKIYQLGKLTDKQIQAATLAEKFTKEMQAVPNSPLNVNVLFLINRAGGNLMAAGKDTVADTAIRLIGAKNAMANSVRFAPLSQEGIIAANPDLVVLTSLSLQSFAAPEDVWQIPGLAHTNAGKHKRLVVVDDIAFLAFGLTIPTELQKMRHVAEQAEKEAK